jgi:hypothetical protein
MQMRKMKNNASDSVAEGKRMDDKSLYQPGVDMVMVEITDHGIVTDSDGRRTFWLEFLPLSRHEDVRECSGVSHRRKCRVFLVPDSAEYGGEYIDPVDIRADVVLRCHNAPDFDLSKDPHGLIGRRLEIPSWMLRWLLMPSVKYIPSWMLRFE